MFAEHIEEYWMMIINKSQFEQQLIAPTNSFEILLRGHLWAEFLLDNLLKIHMTDTGAFDLDRAGFRQKVDIAQAFGFLSADEAGALRALNRLRNKLAHELSSGPSDSDIENLVSALHGRMRSVFDAAISSGATIGDEPITSALVRLKYWLFSFAFSLDAHIALSDYNLRYQSEIMVFHAIKIASEEYSKRPVSDEDARRQAGLPEPPRAEWR
jgi:hypothetical protein